MPKLHIYELAKELNVESKTLLSLLKEMGEFVKSPLSTIEPPVARRLREHFGAPNPPTPPRAPRTSPPPLRPAQAPAKPPPTVPPEVVLAPFPQPSQYRKTRRRYRGVIPRDIQILLDVAGVEMPPTEAEFDEAHAAAGHWGRLIFEPSEIQAWVWSGVTNPHKADTLRSAGHRPEDYRRRRGDVAS